MTRETSDFETPARAATSMIVGAVSGGWDGLVVDICRARVILAGTFPWERSHYWRQAARLGEERGDARGSHRRGQDWRVPRAQPDAKSARRAADRDGRGFPARGECCR